MFLNSNWSLNGKCSIITGDFFYFFYVETLCPLTEEHSCAVTVRVGAAGTCGEIKNTLAARKTVNEIKQKKTNK